MLKVKKRVFLSLLLAVGLLFGTAVYTVAGTSANPDQYWVNLGNYDSTRNLGSAKGRAIFKFAPLPATSGDYLETSVTNGSGYVEAEVTWSGFSNVADRHDWQRSTSGKVTASVYGKFLYSTHFSRHTAKANGCTQFWQNQRD